jgi:hypothetical protein
MKKVHVFTSAACNYIPKVRMLFDSLRRLHPEFVLHLALADLPGSDRDFSTEPFDHWVSIDRLGIPDWKGWAFCHDIVELSTAIKPFMLARLLEREDCSHVLYMDPDTVTFSRLDDLLVALDHGNVLLTPHQTSPEATLEAVMDNEICSLKHGIYNLGFIGVTANDVGREFADWWGSRTYHFCRADIPNGLFTDQRWIDLVPAFFEGVVIMRSSRHNVAPWNLTTRTLTRDATGYLVEGEPLGFYHFTGFDSGAHATMAEKNSGGNAVVRQLVEWYLRETRMLAGDPLAGVKWAFGAYSNGESITRAQRLVYRDRIDLQSAFPDPFDAAGFLSWWNGQGPTEYPALFNPASVAAEESRLASVLGAGYRAGKAVPAWKSAARLARASVANPGEGMRIARRGWETLRREGLRGIKRKLER